MLSAESDMFCDVNKLRRAGFNSQVRLSAGMDTACKPTVHCTWQDDLQRMPACARTMRVSSVSVVMSAQLASLFDFCTLQQSTTTSS